VNVPIPLTLLGAVALSALILSGCQGTRPTSPNAALAIAQWCGQPTAFSAKLLVRSLAVSGDATQVTVYLWRAADGRTRLLVTKLDLDVLELLIQRDGRFTAFAPRSGLQTAGDFNAATLPAGLADVRLLISEVADGPLAASLVPHLVKSSAATAPDQDLVGNASPDRNVTVTLQPGADEVREKVVHDARGLLMYRLRYRDYRAFDDFHRPTKVDGVVADGSSFTAYLRSFDALGDISPERMKLTIPATARAVTATEFLEHLEQ
jgi:hypothetical protein